ncbi:hypothetical protein BOX15_Mlig032775g3 [Macrostomum lignano]|uniref:Uncharacterized protein n=1 Tax=Macrostomum lignano TaxID=282301 RepID=A0A267DYZ0_9PLAT|nr:hypothetical protein BOX15_Mlig032775g2 [Macrostomum lignano]PAA81495.1 hypothetical protein BOX15_Mlig032775g3 [Macrostomum lignano]
MPEPDTVEELVMPQQPDEQPDQQQQQTEAASDEETPVEEPLADPAGEPPVQEFQLHSAGSASITQQPLPLQPLPPPQEGRNWHFTVAFAGPSRVGKTKLICRFTHSQFSDGYTETLSAAPRSKAVAIGRHHVTFQCWDTPGRATLETGLDRQLRFLHALFIVFDASRDCTHELGRWCALAETCGPPRPMLVLVGNKTDLGQHTATLSAARQLAASAAPIFCLSVLADDENVEVDAMMLEVAKELTERHSRPLGGPRPGPAGELPAGPSPDSSSGCGDGDVEDSGVGKAKGDDGRKSGVGAKVKEALTGWLNRCQCC